MPPKRRDSPPEIGCILSRRKREGNSFPSVASLRRFQIGTASVDFKELAPQKSGDLLILDIAMPGRGGVDVLRDLKGVRPKLPILVLSVHPEERLAKRALRAGAAGYVCKEKAPAEFIKAVRKVLAGGRYISATLAEKLATDLAGESDKPIDEILSDREFEVLCLIASGKTVSQIAEQLSLRVKTVSTYRSRILEKMGMKSNAELTHHAVRNNLVD